MAAQANNVSYSARMQQRARSSLVSVASVHTSKYIFPDADGQESVPDLLIALGNRLPREDAATACNFVRIKAQPMIAKAIGDYWATGLQKTSGETLARVMGELVATWAIKKLSTPEAVLAAQEEIIRVLKAIPPTEAVVLHVIKKHYAECKNSSNVVKSVSAAAFRENLGVPDNVQLPDNINWVVYLGWIAQGQASQLDLSSTPGMRDAWINIHRPTGNQIVVADLDITLSDQWRTKWHDATKDNILGFYEMMAYYNESECRSIVVAAALTVITYLTKGRNVSPAWISSRVLRLTNMNSTLKLKDKVDVHSIEAFANLYPQHYEKWATRRTLGRPSKNPQLEINVDQLYDTLLTYYTIWKGPFEYIIAQSAGHNVSCAVTFAEAICKRRKGHVEVIFKIIPPMQIAKFAEFIGDLIYDRFASTITPPVTIKDIPDLTYLGWYTEAGKNANYRNAPVVIRITHISQEILNRAAEKLRETAMDALDNKCFNIKIPGMSVLEKGGVLSLQPGLEAEAGPIIIVNAHPDDLYIHGTFTLSDVEVTALALPGPDAAKDRVMHRINRARECAGLVDKTEINAIIKAIMDGDDGGQSRAAWPCAAKALPRGSRMLSAEELQKLMEAQRTPRTRALIRSCDKSMEVVDQPISPHIYQNNLNPNQLQRRRKVDNQTISDIFLLGGNPKPEWLVDPPPINPMAFTQMTRNQCPARVPGFPAAGQ